MSSELRILKNGKNYYLFLADLSVKGSADVTINKDLNTTNVFPFTEKIQSVSWLDNGEPVDFTQTEGQVNVQPEPFRYGSDYVIRVAKITVE